MDKSDRPASGSGSTDTTTTSRPAEDGRREAAASIDSGPSSEWLVDGFNVLHAILLGGEDRSEWWREPARQRLIDRASRLPPERGRVWLVFDGSVPSPESEPGAAGPSVVFTASADDWIHQRTRRSSGRPFVVTADRKLAKRCRRAGARIVAPGDFVSVCALDDVAARGEAHSERIASAASSNESGHAPQSSRDS